MADVGPSEEFLRQFGEIPAQEPEGDVPLSRAEVPFVPLSHPKYQGLAAEKGYDQSYARIDKIRYSHDAMINLIIAEPAISQNELAGKFGYTAAWVSRIIGSDAFQARLAQRQEEITDPFLIATVEERFRGLAMQSLDVIAKNLATTNNSDLALKALEISTKAMGFGARDRMSGQTNNFVIQLPGKAANAEEWAAAHAPSLAAKKPLPVQHLSTTTTLDPTLPIARTVLAESERHGN